MRRSAIFLGSLAVASALCAVGCAADATDEETPPAEEQELGVGSYPTTWFPSSQADWNIIPAVQAFQAAAPSWARAELDGASSQALHAGVSASFQQDVAEEQGGRAVSMTVELTRQVVDVPWAQFTRRIPPALWGPKLAHYLGGQRRIYARDAQGRITRQLERMVLSPFPCDFESTLTNNDMTKVEVLQYGASSATIFWRVRYSNNNSTETDVGSLDFRAGDAGQTVITFHSAHRLNALGGVHIPGLLLRPLLSNTFLGFTGHYVDLAAGR